MRFFLGLGFFISFGFKIISSYGGKLERFLGAIFVAGLATSFIMFPTPTMGYLSAFVLLEVLAFGLIWYLYGREPRVEVPSIYEREPPYDYSPAVVDALIHQDFKKPRQETLAAEVLDLCAKGKLRLEEVKGGSFWESSSIAITEFI